MTKDESVDVIVRLDTALMALREARKAAVMYEADAGVIVDIATAYRDAWHVRARLTEMTENKPAKPLSD